MGHLALKSHRDGDDDDDEVDNDNNDDFISDVFYNRKNVNYSKSFHFQRYNRIKCMISAKALHNFVNILIIKNDLHNIVRFIPFYFLDTLTKVTIEFLFDLRAFLSLSWMLMMIMVVT